MGLGSFDSVQQTTLPSGISTSPVHVDQYNFSPELRAGLDFGVGIGPNADRLAKASNRVVAKLKRPKGTFLPFFSEEMYPNPEGSHPEGRPMEGQPRVST